MFTYSVSSKYVPACMHTEEGIVLHPANVAKSLKLLSKVLHSFVTCDFCPVHRNAIHYIVYTVEPLNKGHCGGRSFVHYREVVPFGGC